MENKFSGIEKRKTPRLKVSFTLIYKVDSPLEVRMMVGNREVDALMLDLSEGGMAIATNYGIPVKTILSIKFTLINLNAYGDSRIATMELTGEVSNNISLERNEHRLGIRFIDIHAEDRLAIIEFIKTMLSPAGS